MDDEIKQEIESAFKCQNINTLRTVIIEGTYFRIVGWDNVNNFNRKDDIINDVMKFYSIDHIMKCINQLITGLQTMDFHAEMQNYPEYFVEVMCNSNAKILDLSSFESFLIKYSEEGSNKRRIENKIMSFWKDYLIDCYGNEI